MMQVISPLRGFAIEAKDGRIGTVADFLFDDDMESALARRRLRSLADRAQGADPSFGDFAGRLGTTTISRVADEGSGRKEPGIG